MYRPFRVIYWIITFSYLIFFIFQTTNNLSNISTFFDEKNFLITYLLALFGGLIAIENFYRKEGHSVKGNISYTQYFGDPNTTFDTSFRNLTLVNQKDKPIIIFDIYIEVGKHTFVHLKELDKKNPLIIKSYEYYFEVFPEAYFYQYRSSAYSLRKTRLKKNPSIILNTPDGIYKVKIFKHKNEYFNFYSRVLKAIYLSLIPENKTIPLNVSFIIQFHDLNNKYHQILIKDNYTSIQIFDYNIASKNLLTYDFLNEKLNSGIQSGELKISNFKIINFKEAYQKQKDNFIQFRCNNKPLTLENPHDMKQLKHLRLKILKRKILHIKDKLNK